MPSEITARNLSIHDELLAEDGYINAYLEFWFDIGARFELPELWGDDSVNLYANYYLQDKRIEVFCIVKYADGSDSEEFKLSDLSDSEREAILGHMHEAGLNELIAEMQNDAQVVLPEKQAPDIAQRGDNHGGHKRSAKQLEAR